METILNYGSNIFNDGIILFSIKGILLFILAKVLLKIIEKAINKAVVSASKAFQTMAPFYINSLRTIIYGLVFFVILSGIKPLSTLGKTVLGASSILAVIVGLAAQETLSNFISGIILSIYQPFKVGDNVILKEKNIVGTVKTIGFRHTVIKTLENTEIIIPNNIMNTTIIENREIVEKSYRNTLILNISYESDIDQAKGIISKEVLNHPLLIDGRSTKQKKNEESLVTIFLTDFKDYSVELRAIFYTRNFADGYKMSSDLRESIKKEFDANNVVIPYPTRVNKIENK